MSACPARYHHNCPVLKPCWSQTWTQQQTPDRLALSRSCLCPAVAEPVRYQIPLWIVAQYHTVCCACSLNFFLETTCKCWIRNLVVTSVLISLLTWCLTQPRCLHSAAPYICLSVFRNPVTSPACTWCGLKPLLLVMLFTLLAHWSCIVRYILYHKSCNCPQWLKIWWPVG